MFSNADRRRQGGRMVDKQLVNCLFLPKCRSWSNLPRTWTTLKLLQPSVESQLVVDWLKMASMIGCVDLALSALDFHQLRDTSTPKEETHILSYPVTLQVSCSILWHSTFLQGELTCLMLATSNLPSGTGRSELTLITPRTPVTGATCKATTSPCTFESETD